MLGTWTTFSIAIHGLWKCWRDKVTQGCRKVGFTDKMRCKQNFISYTYVCWILFIVFSALGKKEAQINLLKQLYMLASTQRLVAHVALNLLALEAARRFNCLNGISCLQYVQILLFGVFRRVEYDACSVRKQEPNNFSLCSLGTWSKMGIDSTRLSSHFWLTHWLVTGQQPTNRARNQKDGQQLTSTMDARTGQVPKRIVTWRWHKVRRLGSDKIKRKITGWQQATEMDGSNWATAESSKSFNGRAPLFHHHHHLPTNIPFQKNYLVFHISGL